MKGVRTICMATVVAAPAVGFAQDKTYYPTIPPLYDWSKFQPPETGSRGSDQSNIPSIITGRSIAGRPSAWAEAFSPTPMVTPSGTTPPLYDWSKVHRQKG
jgi:hypothetical protein